MAPVTAFVLDAGALIAIERGSQRMQALLDRAARRPDIELLVPACVVGQVWRDGARQARLAKLLNAPQTRIIDLNHARARAVGILLCVSGAEDVVDASVVVCARGHGRNVPVITSDPRDLARLDGALPLVTV
ncbi:MAG TPA: PIN domain nuclease [Gammaproteobacteria bacterium]|nr:PIN domain nuclease [Gammaproteobacteria bacterium]